MIHIDIQKTLPIDPALLETAARQTVDYTNHDPQAGLTLVIGDHSLLQHYNQQYRGVDAPTDVLSFPADYTDPDTHEQYLGDVLISLPAAQKQAEAGGHTLTEELQLLVVHGVLHLLGYDHGEPDETMRMQAAQDAVMGLLGSQNSPRL